mgnify:CR=1 FL=1
MRGLTNIMKWKLEDRYIKFDTLDLVKIDKLDLVKVDKYENYRAIPFLRRSHLLRSQKNVETPAAGRSTPYEPRTRPEPPT